MWFAALCRHPVYARLFTKHEIDFAGRSLHADVTHILAKLVVEFGRVQQGKKRVFRIGIRNDQGRIDRFPRRERNALHPAGLNVDGLDGGIGADGHAEIVAGPSHRLRDRSHAADHVSLPGLLIGITATEQVKQEADRRARLVGAAVLAVQTVRQDESLELVGLESLVEELAQ